MNCLHVPLACNLTNVHTHKQKHIPVPSCIMRCRLDHWVWLLPCSRALPYQTDESVCVMPDDVTYLKRHNHFISLKPPCVLCTCVDGARYQSHTTGMLVLECTCISEGQSAVCLPRRRFIYYIRYSDLTNEKTDATGPGQDQPRVAFKSTRCLGNVLKHVLQTRGHVHNDALMTKEDKQ
jgi:hypothetical protein